MLRVLTRDRHIIRVDELRRAIESIPPRDYETMSYYERWITAIETLIIEKGLLHIQVDRRVETIAATRHVWDTAWSRNSSQGIACAFGSTTRRATSGLQDIFRARPALSRPCMALFAIRKRSPMVMTVCPNNSSISCALSRPTSGRHTPQRQTSSTLTFMSPGYKPA